MDHMYILGISGSPRRTGNTDVLLEQCLSGAAAEGAAVETIYLRDYAIEPCNGCEKCRTDRTCTRFFDGMQLLYPKIERSRGLILGSPTYNYNVTSMVKSFIDRLYPYYRFSDDRPRKYSSYLADQGRKALIFSVCEQEDPVDMGFALEAMELPLTALGFKVVEKMPVYGFFDRGVVREDEGVMANAYETGARFARSLQKD